MGYVASGVRSVPKDGYRWYAFMLEDQWSDARRKEFADNFTPFARSVGPDVLVVRGFEPRVFADDILALYAIANPPKLPAIIVTDRSPSAIVENPPSRDVARTVVFPLGERATGEISQVLDDISAALRDDHGFSALVNADPDVRNRWGNWVSVLELKPAFYGFGVNLNAVIERYMAQRDRRYHSALHHRSVGEDPR